MLFDAVLAAGPVRALVSDTAWLQANARRRGGARRCAGRRRAGRRRRRRGDRRGAARRPGTTWRTLAARRGRRGQPGGRRWPRAVTAEAGPTPAGSSTWARPARTSWTRRRCWSPGRRAGPLLADLDACTAASPSWPPQHRSTVQVGRTLLQQALPTTFGLTAAGWLTGLRRRRALAAVAWRCPRSSAAPSARWRRSARTGPAAPAAFARRLGLAEPALPWHTDRSRIAELAGALGRAARGVAKIAGDVVLLAQTEVGEVREGPRAAAARRPCRTSRTRSPRRRAGRGRAGAGARRRPCSAAMARNTSAPPARGTRSGGR